MAENQLENSIIMDLKVEVAMLKKEVSFINKLFEKMDVVINKIDSQHDILIDKTTKVESTLSFTKEEFVSLYTSFEQTEKEISERINSIERLLTEEIKTINHDLSVRLDKQEKITGNLSNIKMMALGMIALVTWLASNLDFIKNVLH